MKCPHCGGICRKTQKSTSKAGSGCLIILLFGVIGILIFPPLIIVGLIVGLLVMLLGGGGTQGFWVCKGCQSMFPRATESSANFILALIVAAAIFWGYLYMTTMQN